jgi:hypothetical protein
MGKEVTDSRKAWRNQDSREKQQTVPSLSLAPLQGKLKMSSQSKPDAPDDRLAILTTE